MTIWIRGGDLVDPVSETVEKGDVLIEKGKISRMLPPGAFKESGPRIKVIEAAGRMVVPGLVDMHVHLREPGHEYKETVVTGARAAAAGGYTAIACMPNTDPPNDCRAVTEFILEQAERARSIRVYPIAAISKGQAGKTLTNFGELKAAGAVGLSDDGFPVIDSELMRRAIEYAAFYGLRVISHCEDPSLSGDGVMHEGAVSTQIGLAGIPGPSEEIMVYREIALARWTGLPVHIAHVSTAASVALIQRAKSDGVQVTAETAPHYFTLDHRRVIGYDTLAKVNPPLRTEADVAAIKGGLRDGVIDAIATDHAPHSTLEKDLEFDRAAFGMIGLQTALPLTLQLVRDKILSLPEAIGKLSGAGATLLGIGGGRLMEGEPADLAVIDLEYEYIFEEDRILSKSKNSPFIGQALKGMAELTMVGGKVVWEKR